MKGRVLILGKDGQVGRAWARQENIGVVALGRTEANLAEPDKIIEILEKYAPAVVINAAAYTQVDQAESEEALALAVNAETPGMIAMWCARHDVPLVHYSTDYVFDGSGDAPWHESDQPAPKNAYGRSKLAGEQAVARAGGKYLILRTSWVYDAWGKNFFNTMLRLGATHETLKIVADQFGAPTYAPDLAAASLRALKTSMMSANFPSGIYHLCHSGETSWYGFAVKIFNKALQQGAALAVREMIPIATCDYPTPAARPFNSRLDCSLARDILCTELPDWEVGLTHCITARHADS